jgi:hypothetical protein
MQQTLDSFETIHGELHQISLNLRHLNNVEKALLASKDSLTTASFSVNTQIHKMDAIVKSIDQLAALKLNSGQDINRFQEALERLTMTLSELESLARLRLKREIKQLEKAS